MELRDYKHSVGMFEKAIKSLEQDERIPKKNRKLAVDWIVKHKEKLGEKYNSQEEREANAHRMAKTLQHYTVLLKNICYWFNDLLKVDKKELEQFRKDFFELEGKKKQIKSITGKVVKSKREYLVKVIRSDFFKNYLKKENIVKEVFNGKIHEQKKSVEFIEIEDLKKLVELAPYDYQRLALYVIFSTGVRIGCYLNLRKSDFEIKYNPKTKVNYYLCHIKKEYGKSQEDRTVPIIIPECNELLRKYLDKINDNEFISPISYSSLRNMLETVTTEAKIETKPNNQKPTIHVLRKSTAMFLLNAGYSVDQVKAFLGHTPSSDAINVYVNYRGMKFEPEVSRIQTDRLIELEQTIKDNQLQMAALQQQMDQFKETLPKLAEKLLRKKGLK